MCSPSRQAGWHSGIQIAKLAPSDGAPGDGFGGSVAISGNVVLAGASTATVSGNPAQGDPYIFARPSGGGQDATQPAKLTASGGSFLFSYLATIAGRTAIAGGGLPGGANGAIWVFAEPPGGWQNQTQTAEISNPDFLGLAEALSRTTPAAGTIAPANGAVDGIVKPPGGWHSDIQMATSSRAANCLALRWLGSITAPGPDACNDSQPIAVNHRCPPRPKGTQRSVPTARCAWP